MKISHSEQLLLVVFGQKIKICKNLKKAANRFLLIWLVQGAEKKISPKWSFDGTFVIKIFRSEQRLLVAFCRNIEIWKKIFWSLKKILHFWLQTFFFSIPGEIVLAYDSAVRARQFKPLKSKIRSALSLPHFSKRVFAILKNFTKNKQLAKKTLENKNSQFWPNESTQKISLSWHNGK